MEETDILKVGYNNKNLNKSYFEELMIPHLYECIQWYYDEDLSEGRYDAIVARYDPSTPLAYQNNRARGEMVFIDLTLDELSDAIRFLKPLLTSPYKWERFDDFGFELTTQGTPSGQRYTPHFIIYKGMNMMAYTKRLKVYKEDPYLAYKSMYASYLVENPSLFWELLVIGTTRTFTDRFATNNNTQARAYAELCNLAVRLHVGKSLL